MNISILGSTGSIGTQTLEVVDSIGGIKVYGLSTNTRIDLLEEQIRKYKPKLAGVMDEGSAHKLRQRIRDTGTKVVVGREGLIDVATIPEVQVVVTSVVGAVGLIPTYEAIRCGKNIALANKETLVTAGHIIMDEARRNKVSIIPVDSEHSAVFQCLEGNRSKEYVKSIILTASGGPFLGKDREFLKNVTPTDALKHPNWSMGNKISIDSATMMNKGLEVIEARWLFDVDIDKINVVVHPQSIIHSMVEFVDNSVIAQMGAPDMKTPIQYALTYPNRVIGNNQSLNLIKNGPLTFLEPDFENFKCLKIAYDVARQGGSMPTVLNSANEMAVELFLKGKIAFLDIAELIKDALSKHENIVMPTLCDVLKIEAWAREYVANQITN